MSVTLTLTDDQLDALADAVAERLAERSPPASQSGLVDAQTIAAALGISRETVYDHADELGGVRIGDGERPRWRFNLQTAIDAWKPSDPIRATPRRRQSANGHRPLLPVHENGNGATKGTEQ